MCRASPSPTAEATACSLPTSRFGRSKTSRGCPFVSTRAPSPWRPSLRWAPTRCNWSSRRSTRQSPTAASRVASRPTHDSTRWSRTGAAASSTTRSTASSSRRSSSPRTSGPAWTRTFRASFGRPPSTPRGASARSLSRTSISSRRSVARTGSRSSPCRPRSGSASSRPQNTCTRSLRGCSARACSPAFVRHEAQGGARHPKSRVAPRDRAGPYRVISS
mmetsp:Transcript_71948/g.163309  ORF Transcript_71948/g.163309 Transcript_71948/m.163309 type:complete len:219 (-) Transcript_71948:47-703(-)